MQFITITKTEAMKRESFPALNEPIRHWYLPMILGIIFIVIGVRIACTPLASYIGLSVLFTVCFLATGALEISHALVNRRELGNWGWSLVVGITDILIGLLLVSKPGISMLLLPYYIGFGLMFRSVLAIGWSITLHGLGIPDWKNLLLIGILSAILSFVALWNPVFAGLTIVFYTAGAFMLVGLFSIYVAIKLKTLHRRI